MSAWHSAQAFARIADWPGAVVGEGTRPVEAENAEVRGHEPPPQPEERDDADEEQYGDAEDVPVVPETTTMSHSRLKVSSA